MTTNEALQQLIQEAERNLEYALMWSSTIAPSAPLRYKVADQQRIQRAAAELEALRELEAE